MTLFAARLQASPNKPVVVFIRDTTATTSGGQPEVTSSTEVDRRHGILRLPVSLAATRSPSDSDTNSGDSGRGPSCDEATDPTANNGQRPTTTAATHTIDLTSCAAGCLLTLYSIMLRSSHTQRAFLTAAVWGGQRGWPHMYLEVRGGANIQDDLMHC